VLAGRYNKHSGGQFAKFHVISIFWRPSDCCLEKQETTKKAWALCMCALHAKYVGDAAG